MKCPFFTYNFKGKYEKVSKVSFRPSRATSNELTCTFRRVVSILSTRCSTVNWREFISITNSYMLVWVCNRYLQWFYEIRNKQFHPHWSNKYIWIFAWRRRVYAQFAHLINCQNICWGDAKFGICVIQKLVCKYNMKNRDCSACQTAIKGRTIRK